MNLYLIAGFFFILLIIHICNRQPSIEGLNNGNNYKQCMDMAAETYMKDLLEDEGDQIVPGLTYLQGQVNCINEFIINN